MIRLKPERAYLLQNEVFLITTSGSISLHFVLTTIVLFSSFFKPCRVSGGSSKNPTTLDYTSVIKSLQKDLLSKCISVNLYYLCVRVVNHTLHKVFTFHCVLNLVRLWILNYLPKIFIRINEQSSCSALYLSERDLCVSN